MIRDVKNTNYHSHKVQNTISIQYFLKTYTHLFVVNVLVFSRRIKLTFIVRFVIIKHNLIVNSMTRKSSYVNLIYRELTMC